MKSGDQRVSVSAMHSRAANISEVLLISRVTHISSPARQLVPYILSIQRPAVRSISDLSLIDFSTPSSSIRASHPISDEEVDRE